MTEFIKCAHQAILFLHQCILVNQDHCKLTGACLQLTYNHAPFLCLKKAVLQRCVHQRSQVIEKEKNVATKDKK